MLLRETIRGILAEEAGPGKSMELVRRLETLNTNLKAAGSDLVAGVQITGSGDGVEITFAVKMSKEQGISVVALYDNSNDYPPSVTSRLPPRSDIRLPLGSINIGPARRAQGPCGGAWVVQSTENTSSGWGPLLYDLAMEHATANGGGLAPDRVEVSPDASAVWDKYGSARGDVAAQQLDILSSFADEDPRTWGTQLTPEDPSDDCEQDSAQYWAGGKRGSWRRSPLSRAYKKSDGAVTAALEAAGLLWR